MKMMRYLMKWRFVAVVWFLLSCYGLFLRVPSSGVPNVIHLDKMAHFAMFFGQFYLLGRVFVVNRQSQFFGLWLVALLWAVVSELVQGIFTARTMDFWDGVADMAGATLAVLYLYVRRAYHHDLKDH